MKLSGNLWRLWKQGVPRLALLGVLLLAGCEWESKFPDQPLTIICPWSAGGGTDRISRQMGVFLEQELHVPVNVINVTGGSGVTGHTRGARARADGYTLTMTTVELSMLHWRGFTSLTHADFEPLMLLNRDDAAIFVRADSPLRTLDELLAEIQQHPGAMRASGTAHGGVWHVAVAGWLDAKQVDATTVPWISINGAGPSLQELLAGGIDFVCCALPEADVLLSGGQIRCLGVMAPQRVEGYPQVPTFREAGHDWELAGWRGLAAPLGTPEDRLQVLTQALERISERNDFREYMKSSGFSMAIEPPAQFRQSLVEQDELFREILQSDAFSQVGADHFGLYLFPGLVVMALLVSVVATRYEHRTPSLAVTGATLTANMSESSLSTAPKLTVPNSTVPNWYADWGRPLCLIGGVLAYIVLSEPCGFLVTASLVLTCLLIVMGGRWWSSLALGMAISGMMYLCFAVALRVPLPRGWLGE